MDAKVTHEKFCIQDGLVALVKVRSNESGQNANTASPHRLGMLCKELNSIRELGILTGKLSSVIFSGIATLLRGVDVARLVLGFDLDYRERREKVFRVKKP